MNYSSFFSSKGQLNKLPGREDMVQNNAGGFVFQTSDDNILERFLYLGTENGSFYASEQTLTEDMAKSIITMIKGNGHKVVSKTIECLLLNKAPKVDSAIFTLALCATYGEPLVKKVVYNSIKDVCKTSTHLFMFVSNVNNLRGWSRGLRNAVASWYLTQPIDKLAYQVIKYRNREGFTHKDVLRLSHPKTKEEDRNILFKYIVGKIDGLEVPIKLVQDFTKAQTYQGDRLVSLIKSSSITWEMIPTTELSNPNVLVALLENMPLIALIRNLNRFASIGLTGITPTPVSKEIVSKLLNKENVLKSGIHPMTILNSATTYARGRGFKGSSSWTPSGDIVDALYAMYDIALGNVTTTEHNVLVGVDVSGSMAENVSNMNLNASQIANALALTMMKTSPNVSVIGFDTVIKPVAYGRRTGIEEVINKAPHGGGTDCSLPIRYALQTKTYYDTIVILTDNETWAGKKHSLELIKMYKASINENVKIVEVQMVSNKFTSYPKDITNVLGVVGFNNNVIDLINKYIAGSIM